MASNKKIGDAAEEAERERLLDLGYRVYVLQTKSNQGVDIIAVKGAKMKVIEVKANGSNLSSFQKFGGKDFLGDRLNIAAQGELVNSDGKGWAGNGKVYHPAPNKRVEQKTLKAIASELLPLYQRGSGGLTQAGIDKLLANNDAKIDGRKSTVDFEVSRYKVNADTLNAEMIGSPLPWVNQA